MRFRISSRIPALSSRTHSTANSRSKIRNLLKTISCALILTASSSVFADAHFGFGLSDGDKKVTWLQKVVSVSDDIVTKYDDRWNAKEDELSLIDDYETYLKSFKLYMVFRRNF